MGHRSLGTPRAARPRPRWFLDPVAGWFRRLERVTSLSLSRAVFPRVPGIGAPYGWQLRRGMVVSESEIPLPDLPAGLDGLRLLLLTDLHAGPFLGPGVLLETFRRLASLRPEVVLLGGDLVTTSVRDLERVAPALAALRGSLATLAVLGNHDHYTGDPAGLRDLLRGLGIATLHNDAAPVEHPRGRLIVAGVDDRNAGRPDLARALGRARSLLGEGTGPVVLLSHNPDMFFDAARAGVPLTLAGHTHGGQIRIPGLPVLVRMSRFHLDHGRYRHGAAELVVSRGLGVSGLPLRVACSPEVVLITLRSAKRGLPDRQLK
ncbi:MAG: metallophosphoesterase [Acidobacteriota bacterium]